MGQFGCFIVLCHFHLRYLGVVEAFHYHPIRFLFGYAALDQIVVDLGRWAFKIFTDEHTCQRACAFVVYLVSLVAIRSKDTFEYFLPIEVDIEQN
jgi:hypothetical protein